MFNRNKSKDKIKIANTIWYMVYSGALSVCSSKTEDGPLRYKMGHTSFNTNCIKKFMVRLKKMTNGV